MALLKKNHNGYFITYAKDIDNPKYCVVATTICTTTRVPPLATADDNQSTVYIWHQMDLH